MSSSPSPVTGLSSGENEILVSTPRSPNLPSSSRGSSGAGGNLFEWRQRVYAASTFTEGLRVVFEVVPLWVPVAGVLAAAGTYYVSFRVRLFIAQWRIAERRRAERKYELLDNLRGMTTVPMGAVHALGDDDDDDEDEEDEEDETAVSRRDVDEFRSSLGIRLPRDEDLMAMVERMLMSDALPDGWVLYRTSAGIIRFMNLNTQELLFFPPNKRKEKAYIESELRKRNREAMESRYNFSYEDEGMNSSSLSPSGGDVPGFTSTHHGAHDTPGSPSGNASPIDFNDGADAEDQDEEEASMFKRVFNFFLEREQKKIEQDVARARSSREGSVLGPPATGLPSGGGQGGGSSSGGAAGSGGTGHESTTHRAAVSMTYRVVSSSAIHGSRGGNN
ncbi:hypothetical protein ABB37_09321 [Leptomonas pyrrhocoris]|uniref:WW domain-containing protein n=1 Tax=Leptomonas pyrrhocoris TaxID=157538 RepID=A0A0N0DRE3_LEPPY|nr:hypothetical protein ABB37_09321 [Leptomonas pyrrhocoris]KPA74334.1 hypothetical protein ABB37_09321 [Leptomonas pyrrhocoris]|eukprot:XP_015652773.1 hypothetical protein ABB37_09321 [Leptomonas pyrrhocoris]